MTAQDTGPLDWRIAIVDKTGRPTPEFQRRWAIQRNNNALIGSITLGHGVPTGTPEDGAEYIDISTTPFIFYIGSGKTWHQVGVSEFLQLSDTPNSYSGAAGDLVRVNAGGTALEFETLSTLIDTIGATQGDILYRASTGWTVLTPGTSGQVLTTGGAGANPAWATSSGGGGGGQVYEAFGALPLAATFTAVNVQSSTLVDDAVALVLASPGVSGQPSTVWQKAAPTAPWNVYARIKSIVADGRMGICVRNNTSGKILSIQANNSQFAVFRETVTSSSSSFNSTIYSEPHNSSMPLWFRLQNDSTNLVSYISHDGLVWQQIATELISTWVGSADSIGLSFAAPSSTSNILEGWVGSFSTTTPTATGGGGGGTGPQGPAGSPGMPGRDGEDGMDGRPGGRGTQGDTGATGATGSTGATGAAGTNGFNGPPGYDGLDGEDGLPGPQGKTGNTGATGSTGSTGAAGAKGSMGVPGIDGLDAEDGYGYQPIGNYLPLTGGILTGSLTAGNPINVTVVGTAPQFNAYRVESTLSAAYSAGLFSGNGPNSTGALIPTWATVSFRATIPTAGSEQGEMRFSTWHGGASMVDFSMALGNLYTATPSTANLLIDSLQNFYGQPAHGYSRQIPSTGFSITIGNQVAYLILKPAVTLASGTITMPAAPVDGQEVGISSTQIISTLVIQGNTGQTIDGPLTTLTSNGFGRWKYILADTTWYRVG